MAALKDNVMTIKEGVEYRLAVKFRVHSEVISGLKYLHVVKRKGIKVDKMVFVEVFDFVGGDVGIVWTRSRTLRKEVFGGRGA